MAVLDPLKLVIENYPEGETEEMTVENNPEDPTRGSRKLPFSKTLWIEREDFMEIPVKKFFRLSKGASVRLKGAFIITCNDFVKDEKGEISEIRCTYLPESKSGNDTSGLSVKGTIHWVSANHAIQATVNNYDRLFKIADLSLAEGDFKEYINTDALQTLKEVYVEPSLKDAVNGSTFQFMRKGYYCVDKMSKEDNLVLNQTVTLKDNKK